MADKAVDQGGAPGMQTSKRVTWITRFVFVFVGLVFWYLTQSWIGQRELMPGAIGDGGARLASGGQRLLASASESDQSAFDREFSDH